MPNLIEQQIVFDAEFAGAEDGDFDQRSIDEIRMISRRLASSCPLPEFRGVAVVWSDPKSQGFRAPAFHQGIF